MNAEQRTVSGLLRISLYLWGGGVSREVLEWSYTM